MKENRVKRILREGGLALGTHVGGIADPHYAASKAGLHGLSHFLASRLAANRGHGQRAGPGAGHRDQDAARRPGPAARQVPAGRLGQPSQVTDLAAAILAKSLPRPTRSSPSTAASTPDRHRTVFTTACGRPGQAPADIRSAVIHDRYHHQDDDRYAAIEDTYLKCGDV